MRIGIVAYWFNRGQGVVARQLRSALGELGHETFVLARPTRSTNLRPGWIDREGVWSQEGVTAGSAYLMDADEYLRWAEVNGLELVMLDQNYQFGEIERLRRSGVTTIGRFVWEHFAPNHVEPARGAFDRIYSLTACERERYRELGIESPRVRWGCHPDVIAAATDEVGAQPEDGTVRLLFPGGFMSKRKPLTDAITAFRAARGEELRLIVKAQVDRRSTQVRRAIRGGRFGRRDRRIELLVEEAPTDEYLRLMRGADAVLAPSRWEGLGLHLYEATALGVPIITNANPPMNEVVMDGLNGLLVPGIEEGTARSGIPAYVPDADALTGAIERLRDPELRSRLRRGARERRSQLDWRRTIEDLASLIEPDRKENRSDVD